MSAKAEEIMKMASKPNEIRYALSFRPEGEIYSRQVVVVTARDPGFDDIPLGINVTYFIGEELSPAIEALLKDRHRSYKCEVNPGLENAQKEQRKSGKTNEEIDNMYSPLHPILQVYHDNFKAKEFRLPPNIVSISGKLDQSMIEHLKAVEKILGVDIASFKTSYHDKMELDEMLMLLI